MLKAPPQVEAFYRSGGRSREYSRIPVLIPARVEILSVSDCGVYASMPAVMLNLGRGGGKVRVRWDLTPGTRVSISLSVETPGLRLLAEIVWGTQASAFGNEPAMYGVRWVDPLSVEVVQAVLLGQGRSREEEKAHESRV